MDPIIAYVDTAGRPHCLACARALDDDQIDAPLWAGDLDAPEQCATCRRALAPAEAA